MTSAPPLAVHALIFDLDGTLIDSKRDLAASVNAMLEHAHRTPLNDETIASYIGSGASVLVSRALGPAASAGETRDALNFFLDYYEQHELDTTSLYPGVKETLAALSARPLALLTNKPIRMTRRILDGLDIARYFRAVYGGNSFATKKPDPEGATAIIREFGVPSSSVLFVGDSSVDVLTARNAGTLAAAVTYGFGAHDREADPPDFYLDGFADLVPLVNGSKH
jgi:phosphoglycolate phosphatase